MTRKNKDDPQQNRKTDPGEYRHEKPSTPEATRAGAGSTGTPQGGGARGAKAAQSRPDEHDRGHQHTTRSGGPTGE